MKGTILIVENEPMLLRALKRTLSRNQMELIIAKDLDHAQSALDDHPDLDVLLTDFALGPDEDAMALLERAHQEFPGLYAILMSGFAKVELRLPEHLYDAYLHKPFAIADLRALVIEHLSARDDDNA